MPGAHNGRTSTNTELTMVGRPQTQSTQWPNIHEHRAHNGWMSTNTEHTMAGRPQTQSTADNLEEDDLGEDN